ncbi:MAG: biotin--[acetyl-CoA-carboxylase] ligase [Pseudomonadales bacterium]|nr:biotin--[acetyl-CoA-carboxylase] ligase [Pseudomonadales bacterium]
MEQKLLTQLIQTGCQEYTHALEEQAQAYGIPVVREQNKLRLTSSIELLSEEKIRSTLKRPVNLELFWSIGSTNSHLMNSTDRFAGYRVCLAEQQTAGRGRRGRTWVSPFGDNLYISIARRFKRSITDLGGLSLAVGMQVVKELRRCGVQHIGVKWPNDIILGQGKLAGILVEIGAPVADEFNVVVGIGVNTRFRGEDAKLIDQPFSTLEGIVDLSRNDLAGNIVNCVLEGLDVFALDGFDSFYPEWDMLNLYAGQPVFVSLGDSVIRGQDAGIDHGGNFRLKTDDGIRIFNAGEISLRAE